MLGGGGAKNCIQTKYEANFEVKFKLNFDKDRGSKIEKKSNFKKKSGKKLT
jgi:hypothetical protein